MIYYTRGGGGGGDISTNGRGWEVYRKVRIITVDDGRNTKTTAAAALVVYVIRGRYLTFIIYILYVYV